jgi:hypothetical protein
LEAGAEAASGVDLCAGELLLFVVEAVVAAAVVVAGAWSSWAEEELWWSWSSLLPADAL